MHRRRHSNAFPAPMVRQISTVGGQKLPISKKTRMHCDAAMQEARRLFTHRQDVTGFDIGFRTRGNKQTDELRARVHVRAKIPLPELAPSEALPEEIAGVPISVVGGIYRVKRTTISSGHEIRSPFLMGGLSCGRINEGTGTIGAVVIDDNTGKPSLLSTWHVLAGPRARIGDPVLQPGQIDNGVPVRDQVATLTRGTVDDGIDAAIAEIDGHRPWLPLQFGSSAITGKVRDPEVGEILVKSGRSTGQSRARVDGVGFYSMLYEVRPGIEEMREIKGFKLVPVDQGNPDNEEISMICDSGSLWRSEDTGDAVGLHCAGEKMLDPAAEYAIACNLATVLERLNIRLATLADLFDELRSGERSALPDMRTMWSGSRERGLPGASPDLFVAGRAVLPRRGRSREPNHITPILDGRLERGFGIVSDIWPRLQIALRPYRDFDGARLGDKLRTFIPEGNAAAVMARIVNISGAFVDIGLPRVFETDFDGATVFAHVCEDIIGVLQE